METPLDKRVILDPLAGAHKTRIQFQSVEHEDYQDGHARVVVKLSRSGGRVAIGEARGTQTTEGWLRSCARATLQAAERSVDGRLRLSLVGIKAIRAFDSWIIVCAVRAKAPTHTYSLTGAQASDRKDSLDVAVKSVLDALNRVLELYAEGDGDSD